MDLILLVLVCALIGCAVWLITTKVPMPDGWARIIQVFALIVFGLYLVSRLITIPNVLR